MLISNNLKIRVEKENEKFCKKKRFEFVFVFNRKSIGYFVKIRKTTNHLGCFTKFRSKEKRTCRSGCSNEILFAGKRRSSYVFLSFDFSSSNFVVKSIFFEIWILFKIFSRYMTKKNWNYSNVIGLNLLTRFSNLKTFVRENLLFFPLKKFWTFFKDKVRNYFGDNVAFYFAFLEHYTKALIPTALLGKDLFKKICSNFVICVFSSGIFISFWPSSDFFKYALFCIFNVLWWTIFVRKKSLWCSIEWTNVFQSMQMERWKRLTNKLAYQWGSLDLKIYERPRSLYQGELQQSPITGLPERRYPRCVCCSLVFEENIWNETFDLVGNERWKNISLVIRSLLHVSWFHCGFILLITEFNNQPMLDIRYLNRRWPSNPKWCVLFLRPVIRWSSSQSKRFIRKLLVLSLISVRFWWKVEHEKGFFFLIF